MPSIVDPSTTLQSSRCSMHFCPVDDQLLAAKMQSVLTTEYIAMQERELKRYELLIFNMQYALADLNPFQAATYKVFSSINTECFKESNVINSK